MNQAVKTPVDYDVLIVGGGMIGLACAEMLARELPDHRIALVEAKPPQAADGDSELDLRVSALAPASQAILESLGVWQDLPAEKICAYDRMQIWQSAGQAYGQRSISFDAAETGEATLGHIVENRAVRQALWANIESAGRVELLTGHQPDALSINQAACTLGFSAGAEDKTIRSQLIVAADGARSWVRNQVAAEYKERSYGQLGVVAHIATAEPHRHTAWQRFLPGGPVALLPLADGRSSLVWSCPEAQAQELLAIDRADFNKELFTALYGVLGDVECTSDRAAFPLGMGYARHYTGHRFALMGDAAHRVHPLAGQGANLGLLDAAQFAETLGGFLQHPAADAGDRTALRKYERARKKDNLITMRMMDLLNRLFGSPLAKLAGTGMHWVDQSGLLKSQLAAYATGRGRELPAAAQPAAH
ncbi:MAG: UbiH/UbiF/VisC/COQ6 family ubiquinone biosynthesis hydroxylase [Gammaproteobacteria bacterium]